MKVNGKKAKKQIINIYNFESEDIKEESDKNNPKDILRKESKKSFRTVIGNRNKNNGNLRQESDLKIIKYESKDFIVNYIIKIMIYLWLKKIGV